MIWSRIWKRRGCRPCSKGEAWHSCRFFLLTLALMLACSLPAEAALPRIAVAGFSSRIVKTDITMRDIPVQPEAMLPVLRDCLEAELAGDARFELVDCAAEVRQARLDEAEVISALGRGEIVPELADKADYLLYGYLTTLSNVKAQSGLLVFSGRDKTVYAEVSLRVVDAHTGALVFVTTADSRRKSELSYHAIWQRDDHGVEEAVEQALDDAATNLAAQCKAAM